MVSDRSIISVFASLGVLFIFGIYAAYGFSTDDQRRAAFARMRSNGTLDEGAMSHRKESDRKLSGLKGKRDTLKNDIADLKRRLEDPELVGTPEGEQLRRDLAGKEGELKTTEGNIESEQKNYDRLRADEAKANSERAMKKVDDNHTELQRISSEQDAIMARQKEIKTRLADPSIDPDDKKSLEKENRALDRVFSKNKSQVGSLVNESHYAREFAAGEWDAYSKRTGAALNEKRSRVDQIDLEISSLQDKWKEPKDLLADPMSARADQLRIDGLTKERNGVVGTLANIKLEAEESARKTGLGTKGFGDLSDVHTAKYDAMRSESILSRAKNTAIDGMDNSAEVLAGLAADPKYKKAIDGLRAKNPGASGKELVERLAATAERNKNRAYESGMDMLIAANDPEENLSTFERKNLRDKATGALGRQGRWDDMVHKIATASPDAIKPKELVGNEYMATTKDIYDKLPKHKQLAFDYAAKMEDWKHGEVEVNPYKDVGDPATGRKKIVARNDLAVGLEKWKNVGLDTLKNMIADPTSSAFLASEVAAIGVKSSAITGPAGLTVAGVAGGVATVAGIGGLANGFAHNLVEDVTFSPRQLVGSKARRDGNGRLSLSLHGAEAVDFNNAVGQAVVGRVPNKGFIGEAKDVVGAAGKTAADLVTSIPRMLKGGAQKMFDKNSSPYERFEGLSDVTMGVVAPIRAIQGAKKGYSNPNPSWGEIGKTATQMFKGDLFSAPAEAAGMVAAKVKKPVESLARIAAEELNLHDPGPGGTPMGKQKYWNVGENGLLGSVLTGRSKTFTPDYAKNSISDAVEQGIAHAKRAEGARTSGRTKLAEHWEQEARKTQKSIFDVVRGGEATGEASRVYDFAREAQDAIERHIPGTRGPPRRMSSEVYDPFTGDITNRPAPKPQTPIVSVSRTGNKIKVERAKESPPAPQDPPNGEISSKYRDMVNELGRVYKSARPTSKNVAEALDRGDVQSVSQEQADKVRRSLGDMDKLFYDAERNLGPKERTKFQSALSDAEGRVRRDVSPNRLPKISEAMPEDAVVDYDPVNEVDIVNNAAEHVQPEYKKKDLMTRDEYNRRYKDIFNVRRSGEKDPNISPEAKGSKGTRLPSFEELKAEISAEIASAKPFARGLPEPLNREQLKRAAQSGELSRLRDHARRRVLEPPQNDRNSIDELKEFVRQKTPGRTDRFSPSEDAVGKKPVFEFYEDPSAPMGLGRKPLFSVGEQTAERAATRTSGDRGDVEKISGTSDFQDEWGQKTPRDLMEASRLRSSARAATIIDRKSSTTKESPTHELTAEQRKFSIGKTTDAGMNAAREARDPTLTTAQRRTAQKNYQASQERLGQWEESPDVGDVAFRARTGLEKHRPTEKLPGDVLKGAATGKMARGARITEAVDVPDAEALPQLADGRYARTYVTDYGKNVKIGKEGADAVRIKDLRRPATDRGKHPGAFRDVNPENVIGVESLTSEQIAAAKEANMSFKGKSIEKRARAVDDAVAGRASTNEPLVRVGVGKSSGRIPKETLDAIQQDYSVEQVLADHGISKGENGKYAVRSERTPSAGKTRTNNLLYDFGTGKTYNPITLEAELSGVSYGEAARRLLEKRPVSTTRRPEGGRNASSSAPEPMVEVTQNQRDVIAKVRDAANKQLRKAKTPEAEAVRTHLADRGVTPGEIAKNKLGFLPEDITPEKLAKGTGMTVDQLRDAGFVAKSSKGNDYVTLKGRITIPKGDYGMEGRTTKDVTTKNPKYKSLKDLPKREHGIEEIAGDEVVIAEGAFKKFALERKGVENVISTSGSTRPDQLMSELKTKGVKKVRIVPDPDPIDPGKKVSAGFEKADKLEAAAKKAGLDVSRHEFAKPGEVPKGYDIEKYLADGGSLEKIGLKPKRTIFGEKASRAPPGKNKNEPMVSVGNRTATGTRSSPVQQTGAEKQSLRRAVDDLDKAREEMTGVGSEEAAARANQKIQTAKKNLIAAMRDPNIKESLTSEELRTVNYALREPLVSTKNARPRAPPPDPYSKEAREYAQANPGRAGPGAAGKDAPEFSDKIESKKRTRAEVLTPESWKAAPLESVMKRYANADESTRRTIAERLQLHKQNIREGVATGGEAKQRADIDATIKALENPPIRRELAGQTERRQPNIKSLLEKIQTAPGQAERNVAIEDAKRYVKGGVSPGGVEQIRNKYGREFGEEVNDIFDNTTVRTIHRLNPTGRIKGVEIRSPKPGGFRGPVSNAPPKGFSEKLDIGGGEVVYRNPRTGQMYDPSTDRIIRPIGGGAPTPAEALAHERSARESQIRRPDNRPDAQEGLPGLEVEPSRHRVNSADDITYGSKLPYVQELGKKPKGYEVYKKPVTIPGEVPLDLKFVYRGVKKVDGRWVERNKVETLGNLSKRPPPDIFHEESTAGEQAKTLQQSYQEIWGVIKDDPRYTLRQKALLTHLGTMKEYRLENPARGMKSLDAPIEGTEGLSLGEAMPARRANPEQELLDKERDASLSAAVTRAIKRAEKKAGRPLSLDNPSEIERYLSGRDKGKLFKLYLGIQGEE